MCVKVLNPELLKCKVDCKVTYFWNGETFLLPCYCAGNLIIFVSYFYSGNRMYIIINIPVYTK